MFIICNDSYTFNSTVSKTCCRNISIKYFLKSYSDVDFGFRLNRCGDNTNASIYFKIIPYFTFDLIPPAASYSCIINDPFFYQIGIVNQLTGTQEIRYIDVTFTIPSTSTCYFDSSENCTLFQALASVNPNTGIFSFVPEAIYATRPYCKYNF